MRLRLVWLILGAGALIWVALYSSGASPVDAAYSLYRGSIGSGRTLSFTLKDFMPLLLAGIAVFVALRAGLFNIGVEGQLAVGALCSAVVAAGIGGAPGIVLAILAGIAGGALWALPAGLIKAYRGGHEVITTIMLNLIALQMISWLINGPLLKPGGGSAGTRDILKSTQIPQVQLGTIEVSFTIIIGLLVLAAVWVWLKRSVSGYEFQAAGANPAAAELAGVSVSRVTVLAMLISGAIAGLTGALIVLGQEHSFTGAIFANYGFTGLGVALLAGAAPVALMLSAFLFAALEQGKVDLQDYAPKGTIYLIIGVLLLVFAAIRYRKEPTHD
ncbi:MAG: ABC transporter permease [Fimbriimonadaceae bacterium]